MTGWKHFDEVTLRLQPGSLVVVAGRAGSSRTGGSDAIAPNPQASLREYPRFPFAGAGSSWLSLSAAAGPTFCLGHDVGDRNSRWMLWGSIRVAHSAKLPKFEELEWTDKSGTRKSADASKCSSIGCLYSLPPG